MPISTSCAEAGPTKAGIATNTAYREFAVRHATAFQALTERLGLDYFAIDCGETKDGALLLFEADVAMIVHAMDPPEKYPYKRPAMTKLFTAFAEMLRGKATPRL